MTRLRIGAALCAAIAPLGLAAAQAQPTGPAPIADTIVQPVADGVFAAFATHPLVGVDHIAPEDVIIALVRDPRFARDVGNLVLEGGASFHQDIVDRYVAGGSVPYAELRAAWGDAVGPVVAGGGFPRLLAAVREVNATLPADRHIRVWMGEPPVDWSTAGPADTMNAMLSRDSHAANVIVENILANGGKALVYYGGFHFSRNFPGGEMLRSRVEALHPGSFYIVLAYSELHRPSACDPFRERAAEFLPAPALAAPAQGGAPEPAMDACATLDGADLIARGLLSVRGEPPVIDGDAVLFAGPPAPLDAGPQLPDAFLDTEFRREIARRSRLGGPVLPTFPAALSLRKADYEIDLDAPGYAGLLDAMFAAHDRDADGVVTADEYVDPVASAGPGVTPAVAPVPGGAAVPAPSPAGQ